MRLLCRDLYNKDKAIFTNLYWLHYKYNWELFCNIHVLMKMKKMKSLSRVRLFATPWDCSLPGSSVHGIFQARVLEWVAIAFSRGSSPPRDWTWVSHIAGRRFTLWAIREAPMYWWEEYNSSAGGGDKFHLIEVHTKYSLPSNLW